MTPDSNISGTEEAQAVNVALLPCPFCQSASAPKLKRWEMEPAIPGFYVVCDAAGWEGKEGRGCGCSGAYGETEAEAISAWNRRATPSLPQDAAASEDIEEALRLAEVGEYLYNDCTYEYGDGYEEPLEFGIEWSWGQSKPDTYGQGQLLVEAVKWHADQAADGIETEATKLRRIILSQSAALASAREVIDGLLKALKVVEFRSYEPGEATDDEKTMRFEARPAVVAAREWQGR